MPRNRAVDYPQVRPPTTQPCLVAPPQNGIGGSRFSWQDNSSETVLNVGQQEQRQLKIAPALSTLPEHLGGATDSDQDSQRQSEVVLPSQRVAQFQTPQAHPLQTQPQSYFQPDIPRHLQEQQFQSQEEPQGPPLSYEASQAAYQYPSDMRARMQEQALYPGPDQNSRPQLSAHALPADHGYPALGVTQSQDQLQPRQQHDDDADSRERRQQPERQTSSDRKPRQLKPVHVGPDMNPISPSSPVPVASPTCQTFDAPANSAPAQPLRGGSWQHGLASCAEPTTCLSSLCCPCLIYGRTQYRLSLRSAQKDPTNMLGYSSVNGSCIAWSLLPGVNILLTAIQHTRVRKAYEMEVQAGNVASDCLKSMWCCCCVLAQDEKEVKLREEQGRKGQVSQGYASPKGMSFAPLR